MGRKKQTYVADLAKRVLEAAKKPLHYKDVHARAEALGPDRPISALAFYAAMNNCPTIFARVNRGTFGLTARGYHTSETYVKLVTAALAEAGKPLTSSILFHRVSIHRSVNAHTLRLRLDTERVFYRSIERTYGLRIWLPPREKQTIRTPAWKVEDPKSLRRLDYGAAEDE